MYTGWEEAIEAADRGENISLKEIRFKTTGFGLKIFESKVVHALVLILGFCALFIPSGWIVKIAIIIATLIVYICVKNIGENSEYKNKPQIKHKIMFGIVLNRVDEIWYESETVYVHDGLLDGHDELQTKQCSNFELDVALLISNDETLDNKRRISWLKNESRLYMFREEQMSPGTILMAAVSDDGEMAPYVPKYNGNGVMPEDLISRESEKILRDFYREMKGEGRAGTDVYYHPRI